MIVPYTGIKRVDRIVCGNPRIAHQRSGERTVLHDCTIPGVLEVQEVRQRFLTTLKFIIALIFLYCEYRAVRLAFALSK